MALEFRVEGIGVGDESTGINRIVPAMTAGANKIARGGKSIGVLDVLPYNFKITGDNISNITVGEGIASAYGYDLRNSHGQSLNGTPAAAGVKYYFIIADWDLSVIPAKFAIRLLDNGTGSAYTPPTQDNLETSPNGKYSMILYRLTVNTAGTITATANWKTFGVKTISYTAKAEEADGYSSTGNIKAKFAALDNKNTEQDNRLNALGFKQGSTTLPGSVTLTKEAKYAILQGTIEIEDGGWKNYMFTSYKGDPPFVPAKNYELYFFDTNRSFSPVIVKLTADSTVIQVSGLDMGQKAVINIGFEIK